MDHCHNQSFVLLTHSAAAECNTGAEDTNFVIFLPVSLMTQYHTEAIFDVTFSSAGAALCVISHHQLLSSEFGSTSFLMITGSFFGSFAFTVIGLGVIAGACSGLFVSDSVLRSILV